MTEIEKKITYGQFFTELPLWAKPQILDFIRQTNTNIAYDPFVGNGNLLDFAKSIGYIQCIGLDIDKSLSQNWEYNDSLLNIPPVNNSIIITNPPYLAKYSASRKGIYKSIAKYFSNNDYDDLYKVALNRILENSIYSVVIIPETFINSSFSKDRVHSITILEENPFSDTEVPVCVVCFDGDLREERDVSIYKNNRYIGNLEDLEIQRKSPNRIINIEFNNPEGQIGLRAVDSTNPNEKIKFSLVEDLNYNKNNIKTSSRLITIIDVPIINGYNNDSVQNYINECNKILNKYRESIADIMLSPFKGNTKAGKRRRRLDYKTARAILEEAYINLKGEINE